MANEREAQMHLVLLALLGSKFHDDVLKVFESKDYAAGTFDGMVKHARIDTEAHSTRTNQPR